MLKNNKIKKFNMLGRITTVFYLMLILAACQSVPPANETGSVQSPPMEEAQGEEPPLFVVPETPPQVEIAETPADLWQRMRRELHWQSLDTSTVEKARRGYLKQRNYLPVVANRANYYMFYIVEQVEQRGMPMEIALLPLVESTLNPFAASSSSAAGLWQIMPATGRHLGLERNWWYDGRLDLRDSTRAALDYLEELHDDFDGDWLLALAAYNSGKGRVMRAQKANRKRGLATDYWSLKLPRETRNYVPRLIALTQIVADPQRYGAVLPAVPNAPSFDIVSTGGQLELYRAAEIAGIDLSTLRAFNPGQQRWATAPDMPHELLLPVGSAARFEQGLAQLSPDDRVRWQHYRIERGDSLIRIARKFDTQVGLLREVNGIRGNMIRAGDTMLIPQGNAWAASLALASNSKKTPQRYKVRRGDSLYRIAGKFNVSINDIIAWNSLDPNHYLQPGQKLTLYVQDG